jgi:hypothetical protein
MTPLFHIQLPDGQTGTGIPIQLIARLPYVSDRGKISARGTILLGF